MTPTEVRKELNAVGFTVLKCDPEPNGAFLVSIRRVGYGNGTMMHKVSRAGLVLMQYGVVVSNPGVSYLHVKPTKARAM